MTFIRRLYKLLLICITPFTENMYNYTLSFIFKYKTVDNRWIYRPKVEIPGCSQCVFTKSQMGWIQRSHPLLISSLQGIEAEKLVFKLCISSDSSSHTVWSYTGVFEDRKQKSRLKPVNLLWRWWLLDCAGTWNIKGVGRWNFLKLTLTSMAARHSDSPEVRT